MAGADMTHLTQREKECLVLAVSGQDRETAAASLGISARTLEYHLSGAYRKLGKGKLIPAYMEAIRLGELTPGHGFLVSGEL